MKVSLLIPVFNAEASIVNALHSVVNQTVSPDEVLIYDDASSDDTVELIERNFAEVKIIRGSKNRGVGFARSKLLERARGDYVIFLDADDIMRPNRIEKLLNFVRNIRSHSFVLYHDRVASNGTTEYLIKGPKLKEKDFGKHWCYLLGAYQDTSFSGSTATCTLSGYKGWFEAIGGFDRRFRLAEDTDLAIRNSLSWGKVFCISESLLTQRLTNTSYKSRSRELFYQKKLLLKYRGLMSERDVKFSYNWNKVKYQRSIKSLIVCIFLAPIRLSSKVFNAYKSGENYYKNVWR